jgi:hypothetical protein
VTNVATVPSASLRFARVPMRRTYRSSVTAE